MKIIKVTTKDQSWYLKLLELNSKYGHDSIHNLPTTFGCIEGNQLLGFGSVACYHGHWYLRNCVVSPDSRGRGIQKLLIKKRIQFVQNKKGKVLNVSVKPDNCYSLNNLVANGFRFKSRMKYINGIEHQQLYKSLR